VNLETGTIDEDGSGRESLRYCNNCCGGGVGPTTITVLLSQTVDAAESASVKDGCGTKFGQTVNSKH
jgi:hypothetical protein